MKRNLLQGLILFIFLHHGIAQEVNNKSFNSVMASYMNLKNDLVSDRSDSAREAAKALYNAIDNVSKQILSDEKRKAWVLYAEKMSLDAAYIKGTSDLELQRKYFIPLSANMYIEAKAFHTNNADIYYQFCPMADDGKGAYWLSETNEIRNPYFGSKMLSCGSTKEIITAVK